VRRLTISSDACAETLAILVAIAWADGRIDEREKASVRGASQIFNLTKEQRAQIDGMLEKASTLDAVHVDRLKERDRDFAYVAAAWMCGVDEEVAGKEEGMLWRLSDLLSIDDERKTELEAVARSLSAAKGAPRQWGDELAALFKSIPPRLDPGAGDIEVTFE
jgi:uncharacterized membrane protein YebE (DUF533 family)